MPTRRRPRAWPRDRQMGLSRRPKRGAAGGREAARRGAASDLRSFRHRLPPRPPLAGRGTAWAKGRADGCRTQARLSAGEGLPPEPRYSWIDTGGWGGKIPRITPFREEGCEVAGLMTLELLYELYIISGTRSCTRPVHYCSSLMTRPLTTEVTLYQTFFL
jgi:hypothetical protein